MSDPIPPIHLTCQFLLNEVVSFLKPLVLSSHARSDIPRIVFWGGSRYEELELVLLVIDHMFDFRDWPAYQEVLHRDLVKFTPLSMSGVRAIQKFVDKTFRHYSVPGNWAALPIHESKPVHIVQTRVPEDQAQYFQHGHYWNHFGYQLSVVAYSVE